MINRRKAICMPQRTIIAMRPDIKHILARYGIGLREMGRLANVSEATMLIATNYQLDSRRRGGIRETTAWKIANAFSAVSQNATKSPGQPSALTPEEAWNVLFEHREVEASENKGGRPKRESS